MPSRGGFHSMHGFDIDGDDEEDRQIVTGTVGSANDNEAIYSAIRQATEGVALLDNEDQMDSSTRSHISPVDRIRHRRGAFMWLPVWCSNDVEHGSWWFVFGSMFATVISLIPLLKDIITELEPSDDTLPAMSFYGTWVMLAVSGFFYTIGSYFFTRAFQDPPVMPMCSCKIFGTDELVGAWFFLLGTIPGVPFSLMYWGSDPDNFVYIGMCIASVTFVICSLLFVVSCYPSAVKERRQFFKPIMRRCCGPSHWSIKHLQNDWLVTTWVSFWVTVATLVGTIGMFWDSIQAENLLEQIVYGASVLDTMMFLVGSMYFVAGSYPLDIMKCYKPKFKKSAVAGALSITFDSFDH